MTDDNTVVQHPIAAPRTRQMVAGRERPTFELRMSVPYDGDDIVTTVEHARELVAAVRKFMPGVAAELLVNNTPHKL